MCNDANTTLRFSDASATSAVLNIDDTEHSTKRSGRAACGHPLLSKRASPSNHGACCQGSQCGPTTAFGTQTLAIAAFESRFNLCKS